MFKSYHLLQHADGGEKVDFMSLPSVIHEAIFNTMQTHLLSDCCSFLALRLCCKQLKTSSDHVLPGVNFSTSQLAEIQPFLSKLTGLKKISIRSTAAFNFTPSLIFLSNLLPHGQLTHLSLVGLNADESADWTQAQKDAARAELDLTPLALPWCTGLTHLAISHCMCTFLQAQTEARQRTKPDPDSSSSSSSRSNVWDVAATEYTIYRVLFKRVSMLQSLEFRHISPELENMDLYPFKGLKRLTCIASLDVQILELRRWEHLEHFDCSRNIMLALDISHCNALQTLDFSGNRLSRLNLQRCEALTVLRCSRNRISLLELSMCSSLRDLDCSHSAVYKMLLPMGITLQRLNCSQNSLFEPDIFSNQSGLQYLDCSWNQFPEIDLSECSSLLHLDCSNNLLTKLKLAPCRGLQRLDCYRNKLKALSLAAQKALLHLDCSNNSISKLTLAGNISLRHINCSDNCIHRLDLPQTAALQLLDCGKNKLSMLDVSRNTGLLYLSCQLNHLSGLSLGGCRGLQSIICSLNQLPEMDFSSFPYLQQANATGQRPTHM